MKDGLLLLKERKNLSNFNGKSVPNDCLSDILNCARLTPTNNTGQEWKLVAIKDQIKKNRIADWLDNPYLAKAGVIILFFAKEREAFVEYSSMATSAIALSANYYNLGVSVNFLKDKLKTTNLANLVDAPNFYHLMSVISLGYYDFDLSTFEVHPSLTQLICYDSFK